MERIVEPEWLDELPAEDARAIRSRNDLRRINWWMNHVGIMTKCWQKMEAGAWAHRVVELGAGDGTFLLQLARRIAPQSHVTKAVLVDRQKLVTNETRNEFYKLGWELETVTADVFEWLDRKGADEAAVMLTNLFLHHFPEERLRFLLAQISARCRLFAACEPRRSWLALNASRFVGLIGCNEVTRHDAVASVRAGFVDRELSSLWPEKVSWQWEESPSGWVSHCFAACHK